MAEPNTDKLPNKNPLFMIEEEQRDHIAKLNTMEREREERELSRRGNTGPRPPLPPSPVHNRRETKLKQRRQ